jgi:hypothetical protein
MMSASSDQSSPFTEDKKFNMQTGTERRTITLAHSPDSDDAFMFYGLATNKLDTGDLHFQHLLKDIQTLNEEATRGTYDVTAISFHAYAYVADKYALLPHGASIGDNYGPIVVSRDAAKPDDIPELKIAVPGTLTSAFLALRFSIQTLSTSWSPSTKLSIRSKTVPATRAYSFTKVNYFMNRWAYTKSSISASGGMSDTVFRCLWVEM